MDVVSTGPLPVASLRWQARPSVWVLTVVCKATFTLAPGESKLAPQQEPIRERDVHEDDDVARSLREASDLAPFKAGADVVVVGHAFSPGREPVRSLIARLVVGSIDKPIQVCCDRSFNPQGELRDGPRFRRMPLRYEHAAGGPDTSNPAGVAHDTRDALGAITVPNLLPVDHAVTDPGAMIPVVGFGPIGSMWPSRLEKLGRHVASWSSGALLENPFPEDLDRAFFSIAPPDQRVDELRADERIVLENLHPDHPRLVTSLPGVRPRAMFTGPDGDTREIPMRCDTLVIDTDQSLCTATWRGQLSLAKADAAGQVRVAMEQPAPPAPKAPPPPPPKPRAPSLGDSTLAIDMSRPLHDIPLRPSTALPFRPAAPGTPPAAGAPPVPAAAAPSPAPPPAPRPRAPSLGNATLELDMSKPLHDIPLGPAAAFRASPAPPKTVPPPTPSPEAPASASSAAPDSPWAAGAPVPGTGAPQTIGAVLAGATTAGHAPFTTGARTGEIAQATTSTAVAPSRDVVVLVWLDPKAVPRIVRKPAWLRLLDELESEPVDPEVDDPALSDEPAEIEDRTQVLAVLERGAAIDVEGVHEALARAAGKRGKLVPPLELVEGELSFPFDEVETLKALVSTVTPLASGNEALEAALAMAGKFLSTPGVASAPAVADGLCTRIREALAKGKRGRLEERVDEQVERALLEQRHYQRRKVLGGPHVRAMLYTFGARHPLVTYLPVEIADELPLSPRFRVRMIAAIHLAIDAQEVEPAALCAAAIARVVQVRGAR